MIFMGSGFSKAELADTAFIQLVGLINKKHLIQNQNNLHDVLNKTQHMQIQNNFI